MSPNKICFRHFWQLTHDFLLPKSACYHHFHADRFEIISSHKTNTFQKFIGPAIILTARSISLTYFATTDMYSLILHQ